MVHQKEEHKKKIRIFIDAHSFDKEHQGTRTYIKRLYLELSKQENQYQFYFGAVNIKNVEKEFENISGSVFVKYRFSSTLLRLLIDIPLAIKKHKIDFAHFQYISPFVKNCKFIITTHDVLFNDFDSDFSLFYKLSRRFLFKYSLQRAEIKLTVSEYSRKAIHKHYAIQDTHISITPNSVDNNFFEPYLKQDAVKFIKEKYKVFNYILYVSRFEPRKNQSLLLSVFIEQQLYLKGIQLVFIGHRSIASPHFDKLLNGLPSEIKQSIFVFNSMHDDDLMHFYKGSRVFVFPSKAEGFGLPPIEAAALRVPVICSNTTAMKEFSFFGRFHVDPENKKLFSEKLLEIIECPPNDEQLNGVAEEIYSQYSSQLPAKVLHQAILNEFTLG